MLITYIIEKLSDKGGMERILTDKMNYLATHTAHEVVCILLWHDDKPLAYTLHPRIRVLRLNCPCGFAPIGFTLMLWRFRKYIRKLNPDVTVYTWVAGALLACYGGWKGKSIFESHDSFCDMPHKNLVMKAAKNVDCFVTLTDDDAKNYSAVKDIKVISNFTTVSAGNADYSETHCLWMGRIAEKKNLPRMIEIWKHVHDRHPDWILDIVGEGPETNKLERIIADKHLQDSIVLHSATDNVTEYYSHSSIYLLTSKYEGLPMVLIEAQTCGLPIVAFDCDFGPRQVITDGKDGYLIPYDNDQMFIDRLTQLMDNESLRHQMGKAAQIASRRFQPAPIMAQWLKLFTDL